MKVLKVILLIISTLNLKAQVYDIDTVLYNGDINTHINFVILGDGFIDSEQGLFVTYAQSITQSIFSASPFDSYKNYFNVFAIKAPSLESGVSHPGTASDVSEPVIPISDVNGIFKTAFDTYGIHRLLVPNNFTNINTVLANNFPVYDQILIIANSTTYGGSGGVYSTSSVNAQAAELALHELGHSFAGLADEYAVGGQGELPNRTTITDANVIKWKDWLNINNIGIYPIGIGGYQRPHQNCKMRSLGQPFCSVCKEAIIERIHNLVDPIDSYSPANALAISPVFPTLKISLSLLKPIPNTLELTWKLNNIIVGNSDSLLLDYSQVPDGVNTLSVSIVDTTLLSKSNLHASQHTYEIAWTISDPCSVNITLLSPLNDIDSAINAKLRTSGHISARNNISAVGANITYQTGDFIELLPGFSADTETIFKTKIAVTPCE